MLLNNQGRLASLYDTAGRLVQNGTDVYTSSFRSSGVLSYDFEVRPSKAYASFAVEHHLAHAKVRDVSENIGDSQ
jgi:hypothetical protein